MISKRCERSPCHVPAILARCQSPEQALDPAPNRARPLTGWCYWATGPRLQLWAGPCLVFFFFFKFRQFFKCCRSKSAKDCSLHDSISVKDHRNDVALLALPPQSKLPPQAALLDRARACARTARRWRWESPHFFSNSRVPETFARTCNEFPFEFGF